MKTKQNVLDYILYAIDNRLTGNLFVQSAIIYEIRALKDEANVIHEDWITIQNALEEIYTDSSVLDVINQLINNTKVEWPEFSTSTIDALALLSLCMQVDNSPEKQTRGDQTDIILAKKMLALATREVPEECWIALYTVCTVDTIARQLAKGYMENIHPPSTLLQEIGDN